MRTRIGPPDVEIVVPEAIAESLLSGPSLRNLFSGIRFQLLQRGAFEHGQSIRLETSLCLKNIAE
jgi:hypothetical protein